MILHRRLWYRNPCEFLYRFPHKQINDPPLSSGSSSEVELGLNRTSAVVGFKYVNVGGASKSELAFVRIGVAVVAVAVVAVAVVAVAVVAVAVAAYVFFTCLLVCKCFSKSFLLFV